MSEQIGGRAGAALFDAAKDAWVHGLQLSLTVGAGIILAAALLTWKLLPAQPITASSSASATGDDEELSAPEGALSLAD